MWPPFVTEEAAEAMRRRTPAQGRKVTEEEWVAECLRGRHAVDMKIRVFEGEKSPSFDRWWNFEIELQKLELGERVGGRKDSEESIGRDAVAADLSLAQLSFVDFITSGRLP